METPGPNDALPRSFGADFLLLERIGSGGMGEVFLARKTGPAGFEKELVLKRILPHLAGDPRFVEMFLQEARLAARLQHRHIVQIYDFGQVGSEYFLTMEYVPGRDLHWILDRCRQLAIRFPLWNVPDVGAAVCRALEYAQRLPGPDGRPLGIVHRDISPTNILVSESGEVKLLDFGIARKTDALLDPAKTGLKGKALYMSPEQMRGLPVDGRSDIYSLGAVLFELAAGIPHAQAGTRSARALEPRVPRALDRVIRRALAERPADRYQDASSMERELARLRDTRWGRHAGTVPLSALLLSLSSAPERTVLSPTPLHAFADRAPQEDPRRSPAPGARLPRGSPPGLPPPRRLPGRRAAAAVALLLLIAGAAWVLIEASEKRSAARVDAPLPGTKAPEASLATAAGEAASAPLAAPAAAEAARRDDLPALEEVRSEAAALPAWTLRVESVPPGAEVRVDGVLQARKTPFEIAGDDLAADLHIRVTRHGYLPWEATLRPEAGAGAPLTAALQPAPGSISLVSTPPGAEVLLEGRTTNRRTPALMAEVPPGAARRVGLRMDGYSPWEATVTLEPGERKDLAVTLEPSTGGIRLQTVPWTEVYLDGVLLGRTPLERDGIPTGTRQLTLVNRDAGIRTPLTVTIEEGKVLKKRVTYQGLLRVTSNEPSEVLVDGRIVGTTPCDDIPLPAGEYSVVVRGLAGDRERGFQVRVLPDQVTTVSGAAGD